ncbi:PulJ/GspJ family protein [Planococcus halocryophilus]|uniref:PulJ/GspJ family protein n=1 Tax=Planococcus halocryophilus TaxID=1215089 RepID=UPI001F0E0467|nr:prepilin-type N-terminal cleavage/methylation domain-containing protein [Planococcus halocryophilus]MCH4825618.1 prepilin-type N-terminal cleavage/methylation domain-containing protein [Planococcus halocryophilus]
MKSKYFNQQGVTLVELLATILILSIVSALSYTVLNQGYSNYQRIKVETELRDEADLIMASFVSDLFITKESELNLIESCTNGKVQSYVEVTKEDTPTYKTGFKDKEAIVKDQVVQFYDKDIQLVEPSCTGSSSEVLKSRLSSPDGVAYTVKFTLETLKNNKLFSKEFTNVIVVIDD